MSIIDISIVVPAYNSEKYIRSAIESIRISSKYSLEIIVIDDFSTDSTWEIINELKLRNSKIIPVKNRFQKGLVGALNTGLLLAEGRYIARFDSDDINRPNRFDLQYDFLENNPNIDCCGGGYAPFNENGTRLIANHPSNPLIIAIKFISNTYLCHPSVMFRRTVLDVVQRYPDVEAEDFAFFSEVVKSFRCTNLREVLIDYRESESNRSHSKRLQIEESVKKTALSNFNYYLGESIKFDVYFEYQNARIIKKGSLIEIIMINFKVLKIVSHAYKFNKMSREFVKALLYCISDPIKVSVKK